MPYFCLERQHCREEGNNPVWHPPILISIGGEEFRKSGRVFFVLSGEQTWGLASISGEGKGVVIMGVNV